MANERRVRANFLSGVLGVGVAAADVTLSSPDFASLPVVDTTAHLMLVLDPGSAAGAPEIVQVNAHAAGATTVTVVRGRDSSAARAHTSGVRWALSPLASDLPDGYSSDTRHTARHAEALLLPPGFSSTTSTMSAKWNGTHFSWSGRLLWLAAGRGSHWSTSGHYAATMPGSGQIINGYGGVANQTVVAAGIPIPQHSALYVIPTIGGTDGQYGYALVGYGNDFVVPSHWLLVASNTENDNVLKTGWGTTLDRWRPLPFLNSWGNYGQGYTDGSYRKDSDGFVHLRGLVIGGASTAAIATLPTGYRPVGTELQITMGGGGPARVDIQSNGNILPHAGSWIALSGLAPFLAEN